MVGRKLIFEEGLGIKSLIKLIHVSLDQHNLEDKPQLKLMKIQLEKALKYLSKSTNWILETSKTSKSETSAVAVPYLQLLGIVSGGWLLIKSAIIASEQKNNKVVLGARFTRKKNLSAQFFCERWRI